MQTKERLFKEYAPLWKTFHLILFYVYSCWISDSRRFSYPQMLVWAYLILFGLLLIFAVFFCFLFFLENYLQLICLEFGFLNFSVDLYGFVNVVNFCGVVFSKILKHTLFHLCRHWNRFSCCSGGGGGVKSLHFCGLQTRNFILKPYTLPFCLSSPSPSCQKVFIFALFSFRSYAYQTAL